MQGARELIPGWQALSLSISTSSASSFSLSSIAAAALFLHFPSRFLVPSGHPATAFLADKLDSIIANHDGRDDSHVVVDDDRPASWQGGKETSPSFDLLLRDGLSLSREA